MKVIYRFGMSAPPDGDASMTKVLGGKGAHLAEMSKMGIPVPPGFTIPTSMCVEYMKNPDAVMAQVMPPVIEAYKDLCAQLGTEFALVSVRSGAPVSMPGMMNTILNVGLTQNAVAYWRSKLGDRAGLDCYRRLIQMLGETAYGINMAKFEALLTKQKFLAKVREDKDLDGTQLLSLVHAYLVLFEQETGHPFPESVQDQLTASVRAVFESWNNERAKIYRDLNGIDHGMGTAVTVQAMVFGNLNDDSGSGVLFTREPSTGQAVIMGEFLPNAQGEDVVAGIRTPLPLSELNAKWPAVGQKIKDVCIQLESHYKDMMDVEFTVQDQELFILQCRVGKRSALAKLVIANDLHDAGVIDLALALKRLGRADIRSILRPQIDPSFTTKPDYVGIGSTIGVASGKVVLTAEEAMQSKEACILVRDETDPDDIGGMAAAVGILTRTGGATSHAAVVARAMDKACVVGCTGLPPLSTLEGRTVTLDGSTGRVWVDVAVPVIDASDCPALIALAVKVAKEEGTRLAITQEQWRDGIGNGLPRSVVASEEPEVFLADLDLKDVVVDLRKKPLADEFYGLHDLFALQVDHSHAWPNHTALSALAEGGGKLIATDVQRAQLKNLVSSEAFVHLSGKLVEALDQKTLAAWLSKAKEVGADANKLIAALEAVPVTGINSVTAAPPAYILMAALGE